MKRILYTFLALSGLALILSFCGRFHAVGDSLAVLRPVLALIVGGLSVAALLVRPRLFGTVGACLTVFAGLSLAPPAPVSQLPEGAQTYSVYQKNLLFRLPDTRPVSADILKTKADFVMLQELHLRNRAILDELRAEYPYQHFCSFASVGGIAALSRWPAVKGQTKCGEGSGLAAMQIATPDGPLWLVSLHLHWPFPYQQSQQIKVLLPILETLNAPVLIGGDFNMVPWSHAVGKLLRATKTKLSGFAGGTFAFSYLKDGQDIAGWLPLLPIDHVLVPEKGATLSLQRRDRLGSDHYGLLADFAIDARISAMPDGKN